MEKVADTMIENIKSNERLVKAIEKAMEICPDIEIVKFLRYIGSIDDLAYMSDEDMAIQIEHYNELHEFSKREGSFEYCVEPNDVFHMDEYDFVKKCRYSKFTKENEQIAYDRYKLSTEGRVFFDLSEKINMKDFLENFLLEFADADEFADITVINHRDSFLNIFPMAYRHMNGYVVARKGDKYIAKHVYLVKIPCFGELMEHVMYECREEYDECLVIAIDWMESPRFTDYTRHIMYGLEYRREDKVVEIYNDHQTIEKFHEFFQKANKIVSNWTGVMFDDGTYDSE